MPAFVLICFNIPFGFQLWLFRAAIYNIWDFLVAQLVKNLPAMWEIWVQSLGWEDPLEKGVATYFQYSGLENSMDHIVHGSQRVGHD